MTKIHIQSISEYPFFISRALKVEYDKTAYHNYTIELDKDEYVFIHTGSSGKIVVVNTSADIDGEYIFHTVEIPDGMEVEFINWLKLMAI